MVGRLPSVDGGASARADTGFSIRRAHPPTPRARCALGRRRNLAAGAAGRLGSAHGAPGGSCTPCMEPRLKRFTRCSSAGSRQNSAAEFGAAVICGRAADAPPPPSPGASITRMHGLAVDVCRQSPRRRRGGRCRTPTTRRPRSCFRQARGSCGGWSTPPPTAYSACRSRPAAVK